MPIAYCPGASHHLKVLVDAGIFARDMRGVWAYYASCRRPWARCRRY